MTAEQFVKELETLTAEATNHLTGRYVTHAMLSVLAKLVVNHAAGDRAVIDSMVEIIRHRFDFHIIDRIHPHASA